MLEDEGVVTIEEAPHYDMTAFDEAHVCLSIAPHAPCEHVLDPGTGGVDEHASAGFVPLSRSVVAKSEHPDLAVADGGDGFRAGLDRRAAPRCVDGVEDDEAGIVDPAIGIGEGFDDTRLQATAGDVGPQIDRAARGQFSAAAEMIVKPEP